MRLRVINLFAITRLGLEEGCVIFFSKRRANRNIRDNKMNAELHFSLVNAMTIASVAICQLSRRPFRRRMTSLDAGATNVNLVVTWDERCGCVRARVISFPLYISSNWKYE